jgi:hypothetical protein
MFIDQSYVNAVNKMFSNCNCRLHVIVQWTQPTAQSATARHKLNECNGDSGISGRRLGTGIFLRPSNKGHARCFIVQLD